MTGRGGLWLCGLRRALWLCAAQIGYFGRPFETKKLREIQGDDKDYLRFVLGQQPNLMTLTLTPTLTLTLTPTLNLTLTPTLRRSARAECDCVPVCLACRGAPSGRRRWFALLGLGLGLGLGLCLCLGLG